MQVVATFHFPLKAGFLMSDRNRTDLDWKNGSFTRRYRNKLTLERTFSIRSYHLIPYVAAEPYYESQYNKWSTTALYAGCLFPVGKYVEFNTYYEHENSTGKSPNQQQNAIGLALYLYFSMQNNWIEFTAHVRKYGSIPFLFRDIRQICSAHAASVLTQALFVPRARHAFEFVAMVETNRFHFGAFPA
jgi:hypothetical protein